MTPPTPSRRGLAIPAALVWAWLWVGAGCDEAPALTDAEREPATAVELERVERRQVTPALRVPGLVEAKSRIELAFRVTGFVERFEVDEGDTVARGDVLAVLDRADFERETRSAEAALARARAHARDARQTFERRQRLRESGTASQEAYERADSAHEMAEAEVSAARTRVEQARDHLAKATLRAPIDAAIEARLAEPHELASAEAPVLVLTQLETVTVRASLADAAAAGLRVGRPARVWSPLRPDAPLEGKVVRIGVAADVATRTIPFEIELDNAERVLLPQLAVDVEIPTGEPRRELLVPMAAVLRDADTRLFCFLAVESDGALRAERRRVETGAVHGDRIAIASGLREGDRLIVRGQHFLRAGEAVNPVADR
jgi:RND family efflux transporter MFP subunit